ncbi:MAG: hypothetical protein JW809_11730 [Pirellulales bacterium]|nr:hypothetical protein [Pirellulales bacterium]
MELFDAIARRYSYRGEFLGVPAGHTVRVLLPLGKAAQPGIQRPRRPFHERAWFNRHGG